MQQEVLNLLKGHAGFLAGNPKDLSAGQDPRLMIISCSDSRVPPDTIFSTEPGTLFTHRNIGGVVQAGADPSVDAFLHYPLHTFQNLKAIAIMGHTNCGAVRGMVNAILNDAKAETSDVNRWLLPLADETLVKAVRDAKTQGATPDQIAGVVEYLMPLYSAKRLLERKLTVDGAPKPVNDILNDKGIAVVPAVYDLASRQVHLFDPEKLQYRALNELQVAALPQTKPAAPGTVFANVNSTALGVALTQQEIAKGITVGLRELAKMGQASVAR